MLAGNFPANKIFFCLILCIRKSECLVTKPLSCLRSRCYCVNLGNVPLLFLRQFSAMFLQPKNLVLLTIDYVKMIISCSETENPRCSWHYFLALLHPLGYHKKLLKFLVPSVDTLHGYEYYPVPVVHGACYPFTSIDQISLIYIYHICHYYQSDNSGNLELHVRPPSF